jgi:release factor glutamine methyltransferase
VPTIGEALAAARVRIGSVDARVLLRHVLACPATRLITAADLALDEEALGRYQTLVDRREAGEPVAYLVGEREFYGRSFRVTPAVLIPRPETELLVELAIAVCSERRQPRILDLGTGSGAIAITLAMELADASVCGVDRSREALWVAMANAANLGASVSFVESDWFALLGREPFDLIVANPPYVAAADPHLGQGDVRFEPRGALAAGPEGLDDLDRIIADAPRFLDSGGWLLLEHGYDQSAAVRARLLDAGFTDVESWKDLAGIERVSGGRRHIPAGEA